MPNSYRDRHPDATPKNNPCQRSGIKTRICAGKLFDIPKGSKHKRWVYMRLYIYSFTSVNPCIALVEGMSRKNACFSVCWRHAEWLHNASTKQICWWSMGAFPTSVNHNASICCMLPGCACFDEEIGTRCVCTQN